MRMFEGVGSPRDRVATGSDAVLPACATMKIYLPVENPQVFEARG